MRTLFVLLILATPAAADEFTVAAVAGADYRLAQQIGIGNWLTSRLWDSPFGAPLDSDARTLTNFTFWVNDVNAPEDLRYRTAVGVLDFPSWTGDVFTSDWQTAPPRNGEQRIHTVIPGGLYLDPALNYLVYIQPEGDTFGLVPGWTIQTTGTNTTVGVVGMEILFYSFSHLVDLDLAQDRDVAMSATFSKRPVPEPATISLLAVGAIGLLVCRRRVTSPANPWHQE
jgi:hypothetical protein